ncbi:MAG TPA: VOC family protein [Acidimicrobiia bacterium]|nr:VOC family protein [Acidimicrobiia bacterium]
MGGPLEPEMVGVLVHTSEARFPEMRRFYAEILGLGPRSDREGFVSFEWGRIRLTLHLHDRVGGAATDPDRVLLNFEVDDLATWHQRLLAAGTPCLRTPGAEPWGGEVATYSDPDGNLIQLIQF